MTKINPLTEPDAERVAEWLLLEVRRIKELCHEDAVSGIEARFRAAFLCENEAGNTVIAPSVLAAFRRISKNEVVWEKAARLWRLRRAADPPGRRAD
jgi:hypothetical protein